MPSIRNIITGDTKMKVTSHFANKNSHPSSRYRPHWLSSALVALAFAGAGMGASVHAEEAYPSRPISLVIGYAPGGGTDIVGRVLALELEKELGQPVVVDNRPGAGTLIATQYVARAPADGYTLFYGTNGMVINSVMQEPSPYDVIKDFQPIGM